MVSVEGIHDLATALVRVPPYFHQASVRAAPPTDPGLVSCRRRAHAAAWSTWPHILGTTTTEIVPAHAYNLLTPHLRTLFGASGMFVSRANASSTHAYQLHPNPRIGSSRAAPAQNHMHSHPPRPAQRNGQALVSSYHSWAYDQCYTAALYAQRIKAELPSRHMRSPWGRVGGEQGYLYECCLLRSPPSFLQPRINHQQEIQEFTHFNQQPIQPINIITMGPCGTCSNPNCSCADGSCDCVSQSTLMVTLATWLTMSYRSRQYAGRTMRGRER